MKPLVLGARLEGGTVQLDLQRFLITRGLVQANSGAGKSYALRKLLELTFAHVPQVVIDIDGEFFTLRESFPYVLASAGAGGDCRIDVKTAPLFMRRILEHGFSSIVDISELKEHERKRFVRAFLEELMHAPRKLWRPLLVLVDEAHQFCPEKGQAESAAAVIDLMTRGRKRGFCGVLATQRISKLHKDAAAEANNKLIGRAALDVDMKRAAEELGFEGREQRLGLRTMDEGTFYAFGPALTRAVTLMKVGAVQTTHLEPGSRGAAAAPPPPPEKLKAILSTLADLPKDAAAEEGELERLRRENADLRRAGADLGRSRPDARPDDAAIARAREEGRRETLLALRRDLAGPFAALGTVRTGMVSLGQEIERQSARMLEIVGKLPAPMVAGGEASPPPARGATAAPAPRAPARPASGTTWRSGALQRVLDALAELEQLGVDQPERVQVAFLAGYSNLSSKGFANAMGEGRGQGLLDYPGTGRLALTEAGRAVARAPARPSTPAELHERLLRLLGGAHAKVLEPLIQAYPNPMARQELAAAAGYGNLSSKGFANAIGRLRSLGFIDYPAPGFVAAQPVLFLEGK